MKSNKNITVNVKDFRTLKVYQKSLELVNKIYEITKQFPAEEKYHVANQMKRACTSIGANIAEGVGQEYKLKTLSFCNISLGSCNEMRHWIEVAKMQNYIDDKAYRNISNLLDEIYRMLIGYIKMLKRNLDKDKDRMN